MRKLTIILILLLINTALGINLNCGDNCYQDKCPTGDGWGGTCNVAASTDSTAYIRVYCPAAWGINLPATSLDVCTESDDCTLSGVSKSNLCTGTGYSSGTVLNGYCFSDVGDCPTGYSDGGTCSVGNNCQKIEFPKVSSKCQLTVTACGNAEASDHCWKFTWPTTFYGRDSGSSSIVCTNTPSTEGFSLLYKKNGANWDNVVLTSGTWTAGTYKGKKNDGTLYAIALSCSGTSGWVDSSGPVTYSCPCTDKNKCLSIPSDTTSYCLEGRTCYKGFYFDDATFTFGSKGDPVLPAGREAYTHPDTNCEYNPNCDSNGWTGTNTTKVYFYNATSQDNKLVECNKLIGDASKGSFGNLCGTEGFYYDINTSLCLYDLSCVNCKGPFPLDPKGYCGKYPSLDLGGLAATGVTCYKPGTVKPEMGSVSRCYFKKGYKPTSTLDICSISGCIVEYDIMFGDAYTCKADEGAKLKVTSITPPTTSLQSLVTLMSFGFQDVAHYDSNATSEVESCSCSAQSFTGEEKCDDFGLYGTNRQTIWRTEEGVIPPVNCSCLFPSEKLIQGLKWNTTTFTTTYINRSVNDVCNRLFGLQECYWNWTSSKPASFLYKTRGDELDVWESWCKNQGPQSHSCDYMTNQLYRLLFNISTLVDLKVNVFDSNKTVPIFLSTFEKGELAKAGDLSIDYLARLEPLSELNFSFNLITDFKLLGYSKAQLSIYCVEDTGSDGFLDVIIQDTLVGSINCNRNTRWNTLTINVPESMKLGTNLVSLKATNAPVYVGIDSNSTSSWICPTCSSASPKSTDYTGYNKFFITNNKIIGRKTPNSINELGNEAKTLEFNQAIDDVKLVNNDIYILSDSSVYLSDAWESPSIIPSLNASFIASMNNKIYAYTNESKLITLDNSNDPIIIEHVDWLKSANEVIFAGTTLGGVYAIIQSPVNEKELVTTWLPDSYDAVSKPNAIADWDNDGRNDFIGVSRVDAGNVTISLWTAMPFGTFIKSTLLDNVRGPNEISAGEFDMNEKPELLIKNIDSQYLIFKDNGSPVGIQSISPVALDNGNSVSVSGTDWEMLDNNLYTLIPEGIRKYSFFNLTTPGANSIIYRFLVKQDTKYSALDLLYPSIYVPLDKVIINESISGTTSAGKVLYCGSNYYYKLTFNQYETMMHYTDFNYKIRLNDAPLNCDNSQASFTETGDLATSTTYCHMPDCGYGLPEAERFQVCIKAGDFEQENCYALDSIQPLAGNTTGLSTIKAEICNSTMSKFNISGAIIDEKKYYVNVTGVNLYNSTGGLVATNNSVIPTERLTRFFTDLALPGGEYTITAFTLGYFETDLAHSIKNNTANTITCSEGGGGICNACSSCKCNGLNYYSQATCDMISCVCSRVGTPQDCSTTDQCKTASCAEDSGCGIANKPDDTACTTAAGAGACSAGTCVSTCPASGCSANSCPTTTTYATCTKSEGCNFGTLETLNCLTGQSCQSGSCAVISGDGICDKSTEDNCVWSTAGGGLCTTGQGHSSDCPICTSGRSNQNACENP